MRISICGVSWAAWPLSFVSCTLSLSLSSHQGTPLGLCRFASHRPSIAERCLEDALLLWRAHAAVHAVAELGLAFLDRVSDHTPSVVAALMRRDDVIATLREFGSLHPTSCQLMVIRRLQTRLSRVRGSVMVGAGLW